MGQRPLFVPEVIGHGMTPIHTVGLSYPSKAEKGVIPRLCYLKRAWALCGKVFGGRNSTRDQI